MRRVSATISFTTLRDPMSLLRSTSLPFYFSTPLHLYTDMINDTTIPLLPIPLLILLTLN